MKEKLLSEIARGGAQFALLYGAAADTAPDRYRQAIECFYDAFSGEAAVFSASGRVEVVGNHTDHNNGVVLTSSIGTDAVGVAAPNGTNRIRLISKGYDRRYEVSLDELAPMKGENMTTALIRGVAHYFAEHDLTVGGFDAYVSSDVLSGSGLSSSAAFEVLLGCILSHLFNAGKVNAETLALAGKHAENEYAGKPSGLLDQMGSAWGGMITVDFADPAHPQARAVEADFSCSGYTPVIVHPGGGHADLTSEYAAITEEMAAVAAHFGAKKLREVARERFITALPELYKKVPDRAILRALHYYDENERVRRAVKALEDKDFEGFLACVNESGESSWKYLQNCYCGAAQECCVALALARDLLGGRGAVRVHGGGFGGTILTFVPEKETEAFIARMDAVFGTGACDRLYIRPVGAMKVFG